MNQLTANWTKLQKWFQLKKSTKVILWRSFWLGLGILIVVTWILSPWGGSPGGLGIKGGETTHVERDRNWRVTKYSIQAGEAKTAWDWAGLIGVPATLAFLGVWFQSQEQKRASKDATEQRRLAAEESKEETLQRYFDRVAQLLIEKDLIGLSSSLTEPSSILNSANDVIRARTLSVLRSFSGDGGRKRSVVVFLIETEVLRKLNVSLATASLSEADLYGLNLSGVSLSWADLASANLSGAKLGKARLDEAKLIKANLRSAELVEAILGGASLMGADLNGANLSGANLSWANLSGADLSNADLRNADLINANLSGANLTGAVLSGAVLSYADLSETDFSNARLTGADFTEAGFKDTVRPDGTRTNSGFSHFL
ncbi:MULTISPECIES: pentapeptide repeat-containing protein [unclassified Synechococcus]|uniref:pentapeptide repeat-containing protein n=1 Tax=unclassified Synechococcus TaxID=2626047 RepID=UPI001C220EC0|nr:MULTISPECIES: pentapeptide repeat-containing protein [unclassified Synechococcus]